MEQLGGRGELGTPRKCALISPLSPWEPLAPKQPQVQPSLAHRTPRSARPLIGAATPMTAAMNVWRSWAVNPNWKDTFSLLTGTTSPVVSE